MSAIKSIYTRECYLHERLKDFFPQFFETESQEIIDEIVQISLARWNSQIIPEEGTNINLSANIILYQVVLEIEDGIQKRRANIKPAKR